MVEWIYHGVLLRGLIGRCVLCGRCIVLFYCRKFFVNFTPKPLCSCLAASAQKIVEQYCLFKIDHKDKLFLSFAKLTKILRSACLQHFDTPFLLLITIYHVANNLSTPNLKKIWISLLCSCDTREATQKNETLSLCQYPTLCRLKIEHGKYSAL